MYRIGADLGGTNLAVGVVDENDRIISKASTPTRAERTPAEMVDDIVNTANNALILCGAQWDECRGIGVGSPGSCDRKKGVVNNAYNLNWFQVPVCEMLRQRTGLPAFLANDADCAVLGETVAGAAKGHSDVLMITLGTGIGGGVLIDGQIFAGHDSLGGELGHTCICVGGEECSCGERGCWEAYASATALIKQAERAAAEHPESGLNEKGRLDGLKIFAARDEGDETAARVIEKYCEYVAVGLTNMINILYPEVILIGGGISNEGEGLLKPIKGYIEKHFFVKRPELMPKLAIASLGNDAGIIGAAALVDAQGQALPERDRK